MSHASYARPNPKIRPAAPGRLMLRPDGSPDDNDRVEIGPTALTFEQWRALGLQPPNLERLRTFRLQRLRAQLQANDYAGILLFDPLNIRYATDTTNMQLWVAHNPARACFVSADGYVILWDFHLCEHLSAHLPLIREVRTMPPLFFFGSGRSTQAQSARFAAEVDAVVRRHAGGNRRLAVDRIEWLAGKALEAQGLTLFEGQAVTELARVVKGDEEIRAMRCAVAACDAAVAAVAQHIQPGVSENAVWAQLHAENIRRGGEWIETRIMSSGPRTNPWFQESGPRVMAAGDLVALDTDMVGPYGMCADISRTWLVGDGRADAEQRQLFEVAFEHISRNKTLIRPGVGFGELTRRCHRLPERYRAQRYSAMMHGVGQCDGFPSIYYPEDCIDGAFDEFVLEPGMALCVEAYVGAVGGRQGVKLEEQVIVTETGCETLDRTPFDERLMAG